MADCNCAEGLCKHKGIRKDTINGRKARSKAQERKIADSYKRAGFPKSRRVPGSGAFHQAVLFGDVEVENFLLAEAKQTRTGKLVIQTDWLDKIRAEAKSMGKRLWILHGWVADDGQFRKLVTLEEEAWFAILKDYKAMQDELDSERQ